MREGSSSTTTTTATTATTMTMTTDSVENPTNESYSSSFMSLTSQIQPIHLLLVSSVPMCLGAYSGYKLELGRSAAAAAAATAAASKKAGKNVAADMYTPGFTTRGSGLLKRVVGEEVSASAKTTTNAKIRIGNANANITGGTSTSAVKVNPGILAFRALGVGSLLSIGGVGLLTFGVFKVLGCNSLQEMILLCETWAPRKRRELENRWGIRPKSLQHEDVKATQHMNEEQEWEYLKRKYIPELIDDDHHDSTS